MKKLLCAKRYDFGAWINCCKLDKEIASNLENHYTNSGFYLWFIPFSHLQKNERRGTKDVAQKEGEEKTGTAYPYTLFFPGDLPVISTIFGLCGYFVF